MSLEVNGVAEKGHSLARKAKRLVGFRTATEFLGQVEMAKRCDVARRTVRSYVDGERGISDTMLVRAAAALETEAERMLEHARKLRLLAAD